MKNNTFKKVLITTTTLVLLALVVVMCMLPFGKSGELPQLANGMDFSFNQGETKNIGAVARVDGFLTSVAEGVNIKYTKKGFQGAAYEYDRMHIDYTTENAPSNVYLIKDSAQWAAFLGQTNKTVGVLINDITLSNAVLKQMVLANNMTIDGNGYEITVSAKSYNDGPTGDYITATASPTIGSDQVYDGNGRALVGAGFIVGTNRGIIKNLTVKFTSTVVLPQTNTSGVYSSINGIRHNSDKTTCVGILAGINLGTITNVTIDIEKPFHYRRDGSSLAGISTNTSYVGGAVGAAGKNSLTERVTVYNTAGIVAYSKIGPAAVISAGVIANASVEANIRYISTAGAGQVSAYCSIGTDKSYSAGVIGGNYSTERGSVGYSSFTNAKHFVGFISAWVGNSYDNQNTVPGVTGKPTIGRMFGRFNYKACRDILLLFDYSRNGPDTGGQTSEIAIDGQYRLNYKDSTATDIEVWSEAFTTTDTATKGFTTGGFVYKTADGAPNTEAGKVVVSVATGAGIGVTPESVVGGLIGTTHKKLDVNSKGGIIWNSMVQAKANNVFGKGSVETTYLALWTTDCRLVGVTNNNRCYEFGEAVGLKFTSAYGVDEISYVQVMEKGLTEPSLSVVSSINTNFNSYNATGKYSLKLTAEIGGINIGNILPINGKFPGKYHYKVQKPSGASDLDDYVGLFDATNKILSYDSAETINYTFTLLKDELKASGNSSGWQSEYKPTFTINNSTTNGLMSGMYIVANEVNQEPYDFTDAANIHIYTGYTYNQTTNAGGAMFKFTPYKEFYYIPAGATEVQTIKVEVAEPLIVKGVQIDGAAPVVDQDMSVFYEVVDGVRTIIRYEDAIGEWRNKDIVAKIAFRDDESGFKGGKGTYYVEKTITSNENVQFKATDQAGNSTVFDLECKIDKVSPTIGAAYKAMRPKIGDSVVTFDDEQSGIDFNVLSGSAGGTLYFGTKNNEGYIDWIIEQPITGSKTGVTTKVTWTADKDRSPTNLVAKFVSNANNIYTDMHVAEIGGSNATQTQPGDENTIIVGATKNNVPVVLFEVKISTHNLFISLARLRYRLKGSGDLWKELPTDNIASIVNKTYDATRESKYEFSVDFNEFLAGGVTQNVILTRINENGKDAQTRLSRNATLKSADLANIKIEATYGDENSGNVDFVFSATGPTNYNMYFYDGIGASAKKSFNKTMTIQAEISAHNVTITAADTSFVSTYTFGDVINKELTYSDQIKTFGQEIKFRIATNAVTGSNIGEYGIDRVETISGGRNFKVRYDGFNSITIVKKAVSVNVLFGEGSKENDQGFTVAFDGLARTISGYYHDINSQKLSLKVEIFTDEARTVKLVTAEGLDEVSIKAIGKYYITVSIADTNYQLMQGKEHWTFEITKGLLDIDQSLRVFDYSGDRQEYEVRIRMPEGVKASDVFSMSDIKVSYNKYSTCIKRKDPNKPGEFIWEYEGLAAVATSDTHELGAYKVTIRYEDPDNHSGVGQSDGMANYVDKEYYGILIVQQAEARLTTNAEENTLRIAWSGNANHFDMIMANVKLTLPNVLVGADAAKAPKVMSAVSNVAADQVGKSFYPYIKLQTLVNNDWEDVQYWDSTTSAWRFSQVNGQTALGRKTYRITFLGTNEIKSDNMNVILDVVAKQFTFSDSDIASSIEKVYDGQSASVKVANISELQDATITYIYAGEESEKPFEFVNAGRYSVTILIKRDNYADRRVTVTVNITSAIFGEDLTISNVLDQVYDGKDYSPKINGLTQEVVDNKTVYKYNGVEVNYILPRESNVGEHTGQIYISAANYERKTLDYVIKIIPKPVDVIISMPEGSTSVGYVWEKTNIASFVDINGNKVDCRVRFLDATGKAVKLNADKTLPAGKYTVEVIMSNTNYVATADTKSIEVNIGGGGSNNLGAIIGGAVGGVIGLGGIAAIIAVLVIKKKRKA